MQNELKSKNRLCNLYKYVNTVNAYQITNPKKLQQIMKFMKYSN